jgi:hypothetical protein
MPSNARAGWICFESEVAVEAAKSVPYCRLMLRAVQLSSEVYTSCGEEGLRCNVLYPRRSLNLQYSDRVKPLEILTSLWSVLNLICDVTFLIQISSLFGNPLTCQFAVGGGEGEMVFTFFFSPKLFLS